MLSTCESPGAYDADLKPGVASLRIVALGCCSCARTSRTSCSHCGGAAREIQSGCRSVRSRWRYPPSAESLLWRVWGASPASAGALGAIVLPAPAEHRRPPIGGSRLHRIHGGARGHRFRHAPRCAPLRWTWAMHSETAERGSPAQSCPEASRRRSNLARAAVGAGVSSTLEQSRRVTLDSIHRIRFVRAAPTVGKSDDASTKVPEVTPCVRLQRGRWWLKAATVSPPRVWWGVGVG